MRASPPQPFARGGVGALYMYVSNVRHTDVIIQGCPDTTLGNAEDLINTVVV